ncbi:GlsB/YeaQ/YmgE family stress response membrane protein [bacterium]|nr:GlsB/YeaQ/YmgE family stress response membrane protein [bacterium]
MTLLGFLVLLFVAAVCGSIGTSIVGYSPKGCLTSIVLGLAGALIGTWMSRELGIKDFLYIQRIPILWSIVGSSLFVAFIGFLSGRRRKK